MWTSRRPEREPLFDLADYLVFEGRADSFARLLYPEKRSAPTRALLPGEEAEQWEALREDLDSNDRQVWFRYAFGGPDTPRWTLYTIGFRVVQSYLERHPDQSAEEWTAVDARVLLRRSGYEGKAP